MESDQNNADEPAIIPEEQLISIAKSLKNGDYNGQNEDVSKKQLKTTLRAVIKTASCTHLSEGHAATACDTLRACLAQCEVSDGSDIDALAYSRQIWKGVFDLFLRSSESRRPKPLKLLLLALERNWVKIPSQSVKDHLVAYIISKTWQVISLKDDANSAVKPSLQALRHFICKKIIDARDIISIISQELGSRDIDGTDILLAQSTTLPPNSVTKSKYIEHSHRFLYMTLSWVRYPDVAPITGRLIGVFCSSLRAWSSTWEEPPGPATNSHGKQPIWFSALKSYIQKQPELLDLFAIHVFPEIAHQDRAGIADFAETLSLKDLDLANLNAHGSADLHISLLLLRASKEKGDSDAINKESIEVIASHLLCHADAQIRLLAFSVIVHSSTPKSPFLSIVLSSLALALPHYHAEIDPKARQDHLALIKRLFLRLTGLLTNFSRGSFDFKSQDLIPEQDLLAQDSLRSPKPKAASLEQHLTFFEWYRAFLLHELDSTASYQRHAVSLKMVDFLLSNCTASLLRRMSNTAFKAKPRDLDSSFCHDLLTSLLVLVVDPFDDIRELAACILQRIPLEAWTSLTKEAALEVRTLSQICARGLVAGDDASLSAYNSSAISGFTLACQRAAKRAQSTARADHADGFGRLYAFAVGFGTESKQKNTWSDNDQLALRRLMSDLDDRISTIRTDIHTAVKTASLHGLLIAARYLVIRYNSQTPPYKIEPTQRHTWGENVDRLLVLSSDVWSAVKHILCADAPEGYEPDIVNDENPVGSKDLLSFCWRALKESSTLMHSLIAGFKGAPVVQAFQKHHYRTFGELAFTELAELRHRGAFSTVSQTFADCCIRCVESEDLETQSLPKEWYQQKTLLCIQQRASALTRRSAGLPAMIIGILSATPKGPFFDDVLKDLQAIAHIKTETDGNYENLDLPQVHAFNCLKDIFTDARFNTSVEQHMCSSLELAVHALESDRWEVRNCGSMLMKALITRMNDGTNTHSSKAPSSSRHTSSPIYHKFPNVPELILRLLTHKDAVDSEGLHQGVTLPEKLVSQAQHVFPALEIIEQSGIPKQYYAEIRKASWDHLEGPVWAIRDKAAKALSYLPKSDAIESEVKRCLQSSCSSQNSLHGRLLYLRYLTTRFGFDSEADMFEAISKDNFKDCNQCSLDGWQLFTHYLEEDCPENPAFALEVVAKRRCRRLVGKFEETVDGNSVEPDISQTIFADMSASGVSHHPEHADQMLRKTGRFMSSLIKEDTNLTATVDAVVAAWSKALQLALDDNAAAVESLAEFLDIPQSVKLHTDKTLGYLHLFLSLYDSLLDDDEDVRNTGAAAVSKLLAPNAAQDNNAAVRIPLMVPAASHQLLEFLKARYHNSSAFWAEAVQRIIGKPSRRQQLPEFPSPRGSLERLKPEDTTLFVEEKQNLYIDEAKEAGIWLDVLLSMDSSAIEIKTLRKLESWTFEGIDALVETASTEYDGPLGWTSKPEVLALG
ncbi:MAG: hypothetical protein Q9192_004333, partial [Flavoplaca navasiana]